MKHAFLIMAHDNWKILARLIKKLDHIDNDIYLHIDEKAIIEDAKKELQDICRFSKIYYVEKIDASWGGYSLVKCEMRLFNDASKKKYNYYHLLSGIDFPIKPMQEIHCFFEKNNGFEFVHMCDEEFSEKNAGRHQYYRFFQEKIGRNNHSIFYQIERILVFIQRIFKVNRDNNFPNMVYVCGSQWCSITHEAVIFLLNSEELIEKMFKYTRICDEFFVQTILINSQFKEKIYGLKKAVDIHEQNLRSVDWVRGDPYTYKVDDYDELINSNNLFCRKVSDQTKDYEELITKLEML